MSKVTGSSSHGTGRLWLDANCPRGVLNTGGGRLGSVHDLTIDRQTGQVATRSCRSADSSESGTPITPLPGLSCDTIRTSAAMSLRSMKISLRTRRPIRSEPSRLRATPTMRASSTTTRASARTGASQAHSDARKRWRAIGAIRLMAKQDGGSFRRLVRLGAPAPSPPVSLPFKRTRCSLSRPVQPRCSVESNRPETARGGQSGCCRASSAV
jgi:hypothetical protein